jgi:hypothetical protein
MGTSISFRAPPTPRWNAFIAALEAGAPLQRICSELFNSGNEWEDSLGLPAVAVFAAKLVESFDSLPDRLREADQVDATLTNVLAEARGASVDAGFTAALGLAERAFGAVLVRTAAGTRPLAEVTPEAAADIWSAERGDQPGALAERYLAELLGQYARHAVTREAGRLAVGREPRKVSSTRRLADALAETAAQVALVVRIDTDDPSTLRESWASLVDAAFAEGRRLPQEPR